MSLARIGGLGDTSAPIKNHPLLHVKARENEKNEGGQEILENEPEKKISAAPTNILLPSPFFALSQRSSHLLLRVADRRPASHRTLRRALPVCLLHFSYQIRHIIGNRDPNLKITHHHVRRKQQPETCRQRQQPQPQHRQAPLSVVGERPICPQAADTGIGHPTHGIWPT